MFEGMERRKFPRVDAHIPILYKELNAEKDSAKRGLTKNLCQGGVRFNSDRFISLACRMVVEVEVPSSVEPIRAISKVAWIRKLPFGDNYEVGNQFLDMTRKDKDLLSGFIRNMADATTEFSSQD